MNPFFFQKFLAMKNIKYKGTSLIWKKGKQQKSYNSVLKEEMLEVLSLKLEKCQWDPQSPFPINSLNQQKTRKNNDLLRASLVAQTVKNPPAMRKT